MTGARRSLARTATLLALALSAAASAEVLEGRVVGVKDGDSLVLQLGEAQREVRLSGIDAPERGQPWAKRARQALSQRVFGKPVRVIEVDVDRYGRTVGEVYADDVCVGCELVREGHAWVYRRYSDDAVLLELEAEARAQRRGLWALPESQRVAPWEWRQRNAARGAGPEAADPACGAKTTCREMSSCEEARFHLTRCGLGRLDGDGDGVPCESLCAGG